MSFTGSSSDAASRPLSIAGTPAASPLGYYSWTFGQCARDPFYIAVVIYIFFPYFSNVVVGDPVAGQALIGYLNAAAGAIMALTIPFLGAIADKGGRQKPWFAATVLLIGLGAIALWWVKPAGAGLSVLQSLAVLLVILVVFAYSEVFHNAMLPRIAPVDKTGLISGMAYSLGNLGGLSLMLFVLFAFALPGTQDWSFLPTQPLFGLDQATHEHDRIVGPITGIWVLLFSLPVLLFTPDGKATNLGLSEVVRSGLTDVLETVKQLKHYANIARYLLARMFYNDGMVGVLVFGGIYASGTFNWGSTTLLIFGLCTSLSAMVSAYLGGLLDDKLGSMKTLKIAVGMSSLILLTLVSFQPGTIFFVVPVSTEAVWSFPYFSTVAEIAYFCTNQFFALFFVTGLSASRTLMARISPPQMAAQFFGLYGLSGSVTAFLAPLLVATTTTYFQSQRAGFASLVILMLIGGVMLLWVKETQSTVAPRENS